MGKFSSFSLVSGSSAREELKKGNNAGKLI